MIVADTVRPCRCARPIPMADEWWGADWWRCLKCGHDVEVRWEQIGDELRPYWVDDRRAP